MRFSFSERADQFLPRQVADRARPLLARVDQTLAGANAHDHAGRMSLIAFSIRVLSAVIAFFSQVLMARWLGSFDYGIFVVVWVSVLIVGNLSCFGFHTVVIRFIPQYREAERLYALRGILVASQVFTLAASTAIALLGAFGLTFFSSFLEAYYVLPFWLGLLMLPMIALSDTAQGIARANGWAVAALAPAYVIRPVLLLCFMGTAILAGFPADVRTSLLAAIGATYVTTLYQAVRVLWPAQKAVSKAAPVFDMRMWMTVALPIFLIEGFTFILTNADVLIVGYFMDPHDVAIYFATVKTLALVHFVYFAVKTGAAQRYAQLVQASDRGTLADFARQTVHWTFWPSMVMGALVLIGGYPLLLLFGAEFTRGYPLLFVLVLGVLSRASVGPAESLLTMSGHQKLCAWIYGATLSVNLIANAVLIPQIGLWGAAIATATAMGFEAMALAFAVKSRFGFIMLIGCKMTATREE